MGGPPTPMGPPQGAPEMMEGAAPDIEQDSAALAEAVVGRAGGDIQMAVTILDTAKAMLMQSAEQPQMMQGGGAVGSLIGGVHTPGRLFDPRRTSGDLTGGGGRSVMPPSTGPHRNFARPPGGWNMGGPLYAAEGESIDDTEVLKQMIMDELSQEEDKRFRDYQPEYEGLPEDDSFFGKLRKFIPDAFQMNEWLADKRGFPSVSDLDADALRQDKELRGIERGMEGDLAGRRQELRDRTISERISDEELRNEIRMLEKEEPSEARQRALDELMEYRNR
jgi:hypothetical protein